jgi:hypothetical protein
MFSNYAEVIEGHCEPKHKAISRRTTSSFVRILRSGTDCVMVEVRYEACFGSIVVDPELCAARTTH